MGLFKTNTSVDTKASAVVNDSAVAGATLKAALDTLDQEKAPASAGVTVAERTKLDGIEANATADQTGDEIAAAYEGLADVNRLTDARRTKLDGIEANAQVNPANLAALDGPAAAKLNGLEANATADQTGDEIADAYEGLADVNRLTDARAGLLDRLASVDTKAEAAAVEGAIVGRILVTDPLRGGLFRWSAVGELDAGVVWAAADGYWHRVYSGARRPEWYGFDPAGDDAILGDEFATEAEALAEHRWLTNPALVSTVWERSERPDWTTGGVPGIGIADVLAERRSYVALQTALFTPGPLHVEGTLRTERRVVYARSGQRVTGRIETTVVGAPSFPQNGAEVVRFIPAPLLADGEAAGAVVDYTDEGLLGRFDAVRFYPTAFAPGQTAFVIPGPIPSGLAGQVRAWLRLGNRKADSVESTFEDLVRIEPPVDNGDGTWTLAFSDPPPAPTVWTRTLDTVTDLGGGFLELELDAGLGHMWKAHNTHGLAPNPLVTRSVARFYDPADATKTVVATAEVYVPGDQSDKNRHYPVGTTTIQVTNVTGAVVAGLAYDWGNEVHVGAVLHDGRADLLGLERVLRWAAIGTPSAMSAGYLGRPNGDVCGVDVSRLVTYTRCHGVGGRLEHRGQTTTNGNPVTFDCQDSPGLRFAELIASGVVGRVFEAEGPCDGAGADRVDITVDPSRAFVGGALLASPAGGSPYLGDVTVRNGDGVALFATSSFGTGPFGLRLGSLTAVDSKLAKAYVPLVTGPIRVVDTATELDEILDLTFRRRGRKTLTGNTTARFYGAVEAVAFRFTADDPDLLDLPSRLVRIILTSGTGSAFSGQFQNLVQPGRWSYIDLTAAVAEATGTPDDAYSVPIGDYGAVNALQVNPNGAWPAGAAVDVVLVTRTTAARLEAEGDLSSPFDEVFTP